MGLTAERALQVCTACKSRKKACDKLLPVCGYCSKRNLRCVYRAVDDEAQMSGNSEAPALVLSTRARRSWTAYNTSRRRSSISPSLSLTGGHDGLKYILNSHVQRSSQDIGLPLNKISEQYFSTFHNWLPIICPISFNELQSKLIIPPADFSILTLAICLVMACPPLPPSRELASDGPDQLCVFVKMLLAQAQAELPASIHLLQASVLLAAYEYACARPEAAYISLGSCTSMAQILGLDCHTSGKAARTLSDRSRPVTREALNIWWGIVILQR